MYSHDEMKGILHYKENEDKTEATVSIFMQEIMQLDEFSPEDVVKFVNELDLKHKRDETEILNEVKMSLDFAEDVVDMIVAQGIHPVKGEDTHVEFTFLGADEIEGYIAECKKKEKSKRNYFYYAVPDMKLGTVVEAEKGDDGEDIYGNPIPGEHGKSFKIGIGKFLHYDKSEQNAIYADIYGIINIKNNFVDIEEVTEMSQDAMAGYITFFPATLGTEELTVEIIEDALKKGSIFKGYREDMIEQYIKQANDTNEILWYQEVAYGKQPVPGKDAEIILHFKTEKSHGKISETGRMDYKEKEAVVNVSKGTLIAEKIPMVEGEEGFKVNGTPILPPKVSDANLILGQNIDIDNEGLKYFAGVDGHVQLKGREIHVLPHFKVKGDVDLESGNITFVGNVEVFGTVREGFSVMAGGDIVVRGIVEDAKLEAGGNITINKGVAAKGNGHILAKGSITTTFAENANMEAKGDIIIKDEVLNSKLNALGKVILKEKKGAIRGGRITAKLGIEAKTVGSESMSSTQLLVGVDFVAYKRLTQIVKDMKVCDRNLEKIIVSLGPTLANQKIPKLDKYPPKKREVIRKVLQQKRKIEKDKEALVEEKKEIEKELDIYKSSTVKITGDVFSGTRITISNLVYTVEKPLHNITFYINENIGQISYKSN